MRQGDPLSPFLFQVYSEVLSTLIKLAIQEETLKGVQVSRRGPQITHLLFADDCVLFVEANREGASTLHQVHNEYEVCSKQCINYDKSTVFFSTNTLEQDRFGRMVIKSKALQRQ